MLLRVDPISSVPVYAQIVAQVKNAVASGVLRAGDRLPSLRDAARALRINPNTVVKAYRELETQGVVRTEQGRGTLITAAPAPMDAAQRAERLRHLSQHYAVEAYHLGASPEEAIAAAQQALTVLRPEDREETHA